MSEIDNKTCIVNRALGFIKIYTWDSTLQEVILSYCEKHSALWNIFLGWRKSFDIGSYCYMCFWLPTRKFHSLKKLAEKEKESKMTIKELATILTPVAKEHNATVTIPQENQERDSLWRINAKIVENECGGYVDWEEEFYECPYCGEPVYECDWSKEELENFICPICEDVDLER